MVDSVKAAERSNMHRSAYSPFAILSTMSPKIFIRGVAGAVRRLVVRQKIVSDEVRSELSAYQSLQKL